MEDEKLEKSEYTSGYVAGLARERKNFESQIAAKDAEMKDYRDMLIWIYEGFDLGFRIDEEIRSVIDKYPKL